MSGRFHILPLRLRAWLRHPRVRPLVVTASWTLVIFYFLFGLIILTTRWYVLPQVDRYKCEIARTLGDYTHSTVSIGAIEPKWDAFWPSLTLRDVRFIKATTMPTSDDMLVLPKLSASFYWKTLLGTLSFKTLLIEDASLSIRRISPTLFDVGGFVVDTTPQPQSKSSESFDSPLIDWLLHQGRIDVVNSSVSYSDCTREPGDCVETGFKNVNASFERGVIDWKIGIQTALQGRQSNLLDFRAKARPGIFAPSTDYRRWSGEFYFKGDNVDIARLVRGSIIAPAIRSAIGNTETWGTFDDGRISSVTSDLSLNQVELLLGQNLKPLQVAHLNTRFTESFDGKTLRLSTQGIRSTLLSGEATNPINISSEIIFAQTPADIERVSITASHLDLNLLHRLLPSLPIPGPVSKLIGEHHPTGKLSDTVFAWEGSMTQPQNWSFATNFAQLGVESVKNPDSTQPGIPGFENLAGTLALSPMRGELLLQARNARLTFPGVFADPELKTDILDGRVSWDIADGKPLRVDFSDTYISNADLAVRCAGSWLATGGAGTLDLAGDIERVRAASAWRYMPTVVSEGVRDWLRGGLVSGGADGGRLIIRGELSKYPWANSTNPDKELFLVEGYLKDAAIDYVPSLKRLADGTLERASSWPLLTHINGRLIFRGSEMIVQGDSAKTLGTDLNNIRAVIPSLSAGQETRLVIDGHAAGRLQHMLDYLGKSPVGPIIGNTFANAKSTRDASLDLHLDIPLLHAEDTLVEGRVHLSGNDLAIGYPIPPLTGVYGSVGFTHRGANADRLIGKAFGNDVSVSISTSADGTIGIAANGHFAPENILFFNDTPVVKQALSRLSGLAPFVANVAIRKPEGVTVTVQSSLEGIASHYAAPMSKTAKTHWPSTFTYSPLLRRGQRGGLISLELGKALGLKMQIPSEGSALPFLGTVAIGKKASLPNTGLAVEVLAKHLSYESWHNDIEALTRAALQSTTASSPNTAMTKVPLGLERISLDVDNLHAAGMDFTQVTARVSKTAETIWRTRITSDHLEGVVTFDTRGNGLVQGALSRLHLPERTTDRLSSLLNTTHKTTTNLELPGIEATVEDFSYAGKKLGSLSLRSHHGGYKNAPWFIDSLVLSNPYAKLSVTGSYKPNQTNIKATVGLINGGKLLTSLGFAGVISGMKGDIKSELSWQGLPWAPRLETLNGKLNTSVRNGSFIQADTGAGGTLLSLLSFQSLLRRLTLDFSDLAHTGFAFDSISGETLITNGITHTENTRIEGPQATVIFSGDTNFVKDTIDARVLVLPDINAGNASLALAFVNPAVGIGSFLAQLVLKDPLSKLFSVEYAVSGALSDPVLTKMENPLRAKKQESLDSVPMYR